MSKTPPATTPPTTSGKPPSEPINFVSAESRTGMPPVKSRRLPAIRLLAALSNAPRATEDFPAPAASAS